MASRYLDCHFVGGVLKIRHSPAWEELYCVAGRGEIPRTVKRAGLRSLGCSLYRTVRRDYLGFPYQIDGFPGAKGPSVSAVVTACRLSGTGGSTVRMV